MTTKTRSDFDKWVIGWIAGKAKSKAIMGNPTVKEAFEAGQKSVDEELLKHLENCIVAMTECDCHPEVSGRADYALTLYREAQSAQH